MLKKTKLFLILSLSLILIILNNFLAVNAQEGLDTPSSEVTSDLEFDISDLNIGPQVISGEEITIDKEIWGELFASGSRLNIEADLKENLFYTGNQLNLNKKVGGSVFTIGQEINLNAEVGSNIFGIVSDANIGGIVDRDIYLVADRVLITGQIGEDLYIIANEVYINTDTVLGDVNIQAKVVKVKEGLELYKYSQININEEEYDNLSSFYTNDIPSTLEGESNASVLFNDVLDINNLLIVLSGIVGSVFLTWLLFKFLPEKSNRVVKNLDVNKNDVLRNVKLGSIGLIGVLLGVMTTIIILIAGTITHGIVFILFLPLLSIIIPLVLIVLTFAKYISAYKLGELMVNKLNSKYSNVILNSFVGTVVLTVFLLLLSLIPIVGATLAVFLGMIYTAWGLGGVLHTIKQDKMNK